MIFSSRRQLAAFGFWAFVQLVPALFGVAAAASKNDDKHTIERLLSSMTLEDKIGQMAQVDINELVEDDPNEEGKLRLSEEKVQRVIGEHGVGSVLNVILGRPFTPTEFREAAVYIQQVAKNYSRPPVIWGLDSVHGANYVRGATLTPQPINIAATFNISVASRAGFLSSRDTRAVGINWLFAPLMGLSIEPMWSRVYETFGEDPLLVAKMGSQFIAGIQADAQDGGIPSKAAACAKHFVGYSAPHNGHDRSPAWIPTRHLYQYFVPPWQAAIEEQNVLTVMESYSETDGVPNIANPNTLQYLLRQRLGFKGVLVSDFEEILNLKNWHHITSNEHDSVVHTLREGSLDMSMIPHDEVGFQDSIMQGISNGSLVEGRINKSVERVLQLKSTLNMFHEELVIHDVNLDKIGQDEEEGLDMARQSIVLVKNDQNTLPLDTKLKGKILVAGPSSNSLVYQSGGWTGTWQGIPVDDADKYLTYGTSVLNAMNTTFSTESVKFACGVDILGENCEDADNLKDDSTLNGILDEVNGVYGKFKDWAGLGAGEPSSSMQRAAALAKDVDTVVICIGEEAYAEKPGDIRNMNLPDGQYELVAFIKSHTKAKIVLVYFGGRPRLLRAVEEFADAILVGFSPGPSGGQAVADLISGKTNPSGKLPITFPKFEDGGGSPYFHTVSDQCTQGEDNTTLPHWDYVQCEVQWPFGFGLSYTNFEYSQLSLSTKDLQYAPTALLRAKNEPLHVSINVKNKGSVAGSETVFFFTFDEARSTTPEFKRLRAFEKIFLEPGNETTLTVSIPINSLKFVGPHDDTHFILEDGLRFRVGVGATTNCRSDGEDSVLCSDSVTVHTGDEYVAACESACVLWAGSGCAEAFKLSDKKCLSMCSDVAKNSDVAKHLGEGEDGWGWNYVGCLESVVWGFRDDNTNSHCGAMTSLCRDIFKTEGVDSFGHGLAIDFAGSTAGFTSVIVALCAGMIASVLVVYTLRGGFEKRDRAAIEFSRVSNEESLTI